MKERLAELMQAYGLTAGRFAEAMGIQASSVSHLLSGRNNPNFDFLVKLFERFPDVSPDWFLRGEGSMSRSAGNPLPGSASSSVDLFSSTASETTLNQPVNNSSVDLNQAARVLTTSESSGKKITRIIAFFSDGTFSSFQEEE